MSVLFAEHCGIILLSLENMHFARSEEHTSELQSQSNLVCRLLLEKKTIELRPRRPGPPERPQPTVPPTEAAIQHGTCRHDRIHFTTPRMSAQLARAPGSYAAGRRY